MRKEGVKRLILAILEQSVIDYYEFKRGTGLRRSALFFIFNEKGYERYELQFEENDPLLPSWFVRRYLRQIYVFLRKHNGSLYNALLESYYIQNHLFDAERDRVKDRISKIENQRQSLKERKQKAFQKILRIISSQA